MKLQEAFNLQSKYKVISVLLDSGEYSVTNCHIAKISDSWVAIDRDSEVIAVARTQVKLIETIKTMLKGCK